MTSHWERGGANFTSRKFLFKFRFEVENVSGREESLGVILA